MRSVVVVERLKGSGIGDYLELTKPEVTCWVVISTVAGFAIASRPLELVLLLHTLLGTGLVSAGTAAFNQVWEWEDDAKMRRSCSRPIPAGRVRPTSAWCFAAVLSLMGIVYLALLVNLLASVLAFAALASRSVDDSVAVVAL